MVVGWLKACKGGNVMQDHLNTRRYISKQKPCYVNDPIEINPKKTAIILIDLWNESVLTKLILERINPLLKAARQKGVLIIHAPSQRYEDMHPDLDINTDDLLISGYDDFGQELCKRQINTLLYAGFDTLFCVLDKPLGAINNHISYTGKNFKYILIRDGTSSGYYETQALGVNIFEKLFGLTTTVLELLDFFHAIPIDYTYQEVNTLSHGNEVGIPDRVNNIYSGNSLIVLFNSNDNKADLFSVLQWAKNQGILAVQVLIDKEAIKYKDVSCVQSEKQFLTFIRNNNIHDLFYAGGGLDEEMIHGICGIMRLYIQKRYRNNPTPNCHIIRDYSWITTQPLSASYNVIRDTLVERYRGVKGISFAQLKIQIRRGHVKENKYLKLFDFYNRVKKYSLYFIGYGVFAFFLGVVFIILLIKYI